MLRRSPRVTPRSRIIAVRWRGGGMMICEVFSDTENKARQRAAFRLVSNSIEHDPCAQRTGGILWRSLRHRQ